MMDYQNLVSKSTTVLYKFKSKCFNAFKCQREAIELFQEGELKECLNTMKQNEVEFEYEIKKFQCLFSPKIGIGLLKNQIK